MDLCFPRSAQANVILGADSLIGAGVVRPHWQMVPFRGMEVERYFGLIDFMVYFTQPTLRESFGRVLAEAMAAGKVVITDPDTASTFGDGVIGGQPQEVDAIVARHIADPRLYAAQVARGQGRLSDFSAAAFRDVLAAALTSARQGLAA
jgi:glycosyltransferase involved in cell wall biosynthesis